MPWRNEIFKLLKYNNAVVSKAIEILKDILPGKCVYREDGGIRTIIVEEMTKMLLEKNRDKIDLSQICEKCNSIEKCPFKKENN